MGEKTEQVEKSIRALIKTTAKTADHKLPSERTLAAELGAGRTTIRLVLSKLATEGLIEARHGWGYTVTKTQR